MAVTWGSGSGSSNPHYVGIDYSINSARTQITWAFYVRATYPVSDNQTLTLTGALSGSYNYFKDGPAQQHIVTRTQNVSPGQTTSVGAKVSGVYNGGTPSHSRSVTVPPVVPSAPGTASVTSLGSTSASVTWNAPSNNGGSPIIEYQHQRARNSSFTSGAVAYTQTSRSKTHTGLDPGTTYYVRTRARNSAGWSGWSGTRSFTTDPLPPLAPGGTSVSLVGNQPRMEWSAAATRGTPVTGYQLQRAYNSSFTSGVATSATLAASARSYTFTGTLTPGSTVYMRVRANSAAGWGAWSTVRSVLIPGGVWAKVSGSWRRGETVWVKVSGSWRQGRVYVKVGGSWRG